MTRARAIELLKGIQLCCDLDDCTNAWDCDECDEAFRMAIEALEQEETLQHLTEPNKSDLISRQVALRNYQDVCSNVFCAECKASDENGTCKLESFINNLPSAERHSAWVYREDEAGHDGFRCEKCDTFYPWYYEYYHSADDFISDYNFCPHCGARMDGDEE